MHAQSWWIEALTKWLAGLIFGCLVAIVLVLVSAYLMPEIEDAGIDAGLRAKTRVMPPALARQEIDTGVKGYVFLDVDPGGGSEILRSSVRRAADEARYAELSASEAACEALSEHDDAYRLVRTGTEAAPNDVPESQRTALNCHTLRPLNRFLLARLVAGLRERGARLVLIDVLLADDPTLFEPGETNALRHELLSRQPDVAPTLFALPAETANMDQSTARVLSNIDVPIVDIRAETLRAGPVSPEPGVPVRRYTGCYLRNVAADEPVASRNLHELPSLPLLAAMTLRKETDESLACAPYAAREAPRIIYSMPGLLMHPAMRGQGREATARFVRMRSVYVRCPAELFWRAGSSCELHQTYAGKVVIIGASSAARNDRHYTPLGEMAGAEVVLNATRSFLLYPDPHIKSLAQRIGKKLYLTLVCSFVWLALWLIFSRIDQSILARRAVTTVALKLPLVVLAIAAVLFVALRMSFSPADPTPRLDVLIPVLAVGLELYAEGAKQLLDWIEHGVHRLLHLAK